LGASSIAPSSRCEAVDKRTSWVSVSFIGISAWVATASRAVTTQAPHSNECRRGGEPVSAFRRHASRNSDARCAAKCPVQRDQESYWIACNQRCMPTDRAIRATSAMQRDDPSGASGVLPRFGITHELQLRCAAAQTRIVPYSSTGPNAAPACSLRPVGHLLRQRVGAS
jgi:hypothetical protein